jgi:hypothetical protein
MSGRNAVFTTVLVFMLLGTYQLQAQYESGWTNSGWVSPGLRFGHRFGEGGGFFFGAEVTYMKWTDHGIYGAVGSVDLLFGNPEYRPGIRLQVGPQISFGAAGTSFGYSWQTFRGNSRSGYFATLYTLMVVMPHFGFEYIPADDESRVEAGLLLKFPKQVDGAKLRGPGG